MALLTDVLQDALVDFGVLSPLNEFCEVLSGFFLIFLDVPFLVRLLRIGVRPSLPYDRRVIAHG